MSDRRRHPTRWVAGAVLLVAVIALYILAVANRPH